MRRTWGILLALAVIAPSAAPAAAPGASSPTVVLVVRHAEREAPTEADPPLTPAGERRAEALARVAGDAGVRAIFVTPTRRTRRTVAPLAKRLGLEPITYEPKGYDALAADIRSRFAGKTVLVCGHSNTVPGIVAALGGGAVSVDDEEFDRLFVLVIPGPGGGPATALALRYGAGA